LKEWTKVEELVEKYWEARYIDPKKFEIKTEILIYNEVVAMYDFRKEIFCVEIYNQNLAEMQKQLFEFIWNLAEKPIIGRGGRTSLF
jgi:bisphosphoglycerate-independent phosphoglycerate mutase (AlkP superfamily)